MAVITPLRTDGQGSDFAVSQLDAILWNLTGLVKTQRLFFDVGMLLKAGTTGLSQFDLVVPFRIESKLQWSDLLASTSWMDRRAELNGLLAHGLIFPGGQLKWSEGAETPYFLPNGSGVTEQVPISRLTWENHDSKFGRGFTRLTFRLVNPILANESGYVRIRLFVVGRTASVLWKRSGIGINGAAIDVELGNFRVPEEKMQTKLSDGRVTIANCTFTVVLRSSLQLRTRYPLGVQPALLERGIWEPYLGRQTDFRRQGSLIGYTVAAEASHVVVEGHGGVQGDTDRNGPNNFAASLFLDVSREFGLLPFGNILRTFIAVVVAFFMFGLIGSVHDGWTVGRVADDIGSWIAQHVFLSSSVSGAIVLVVGLEATVTRWQQFVRTNRIRIHALERWIMRAIAQGSKSP